MTEASARPGAKAVVIGGGLLGLEAAAALRLRGMEVTVLHPPYAGTDVTEESWQTDIVRDASNLNFFLFEFPFEMVAGEWAIQASHRGQIVYSVSFKVVDPARIPNLASYCSGSLLS